MPNRRDLPTRPSPWGIGWANSSRLPLSGEAPRVCCMSGEIAHKTDQAQDERQGHGAGGHIGRPPARKVPASSQCGESGRTDAAQCPQGAGHQQQHKREPAAATWPPRTAGRGSRGCRGTISPWLSFQFLGGIDVHGQVIVVEVEHDGQGDGSLGRGQDDHEQGKYLPFDLKVVL